MSIEPIPPDDERVASIIVDAAIAVHRALGPGLLESVYEVCLAHELRKRGLKVERQIPVPIQYDGLQFEEGFRCDLLVDSRIICEIKSVQELHPVFTAQVLTHLRLTNLRLAFLINFNVKLLKDGLHRIAR
ncbi:MAG TPA: GxxExxY protein [Pirellulaceae bacterium]